MSHYFIQGHSQTICGIAVVTHRQETAWHGFGPECTDCRHAISLLEGVESSKHEVQQHYSFAGRDRTLCGIACVTQPNTGWIGHNHAVSSCAACVSAEQRYAESGSPHSIRGEPDLTLTTDSTIAEAVNNPSHYGGADNCYEAIKVIDAWQLGFCLGNTVKYISRAGKKDAAKTLEDLRKARWYLEHEIQLLEAKNPA